MENGFYWENDNSIVQNTNNNLAGEMEIWMTNGKYWDENLKSSEPIDQLSLLLKKWIQNGNYWNTGK